jgi:hypothetical protein
MKDYKKLEEEIANKFLAWPLPSSVRSDDCVTMQNCTHRSGTNLLTYNEALQMAREVVTPLLKNQAVSTNRDAVIQKQIDEIMDWFPFEKIHAQMIHEKWTWNGNLQPPEIPELRKAARERLLSASRIESDGVLCGYSSSGGFSARCVEGVEDGKKWLRLSLVFGHEWDCDGEDYE